jgi:hypothetical protein
LLVPARQMPPLTRRLFSDTIAVNSNARTGDGNMEGETEKRPKRMTCWNCPRYDRAGMRCRDGKANPKRKSDTVAVAEALGLRALCHYNPFREAIAMRMFQPGAASTIQMAAQSRRGRRRRTLVEVLAAQPQSPDPLQAGAESAAE